MSSTKRFSAEGARCRMKVHNVSELAIYLLGTICLGFELLVALTSLS